MKVREATPLDFDNIHKLLSRLNNTTLSKTDWKKITQVNFDVTNNHYGYVLEVDTQLLGFIGTVFSQRSIKGEELKFCNFHSWIVDPVAKMGGMALLLKVLKQKEYIITNFTASEAPYKIFKSLKFNEVKYKNYKLFPLQSLKSSAKVKIQKIKDVNAANLLDTNELKLYDDHKNFENTQFLYIKAENDSTFVVCKKRLYIPGIFNRVSFLKKILKNKLVLSEIHYISNPELFFNAFSQTSTAIKICRKLGGTMGLLVADRYMPEFTSLKKKYYPSKRPYMYRNTESDSLIDTLYSEFFILNF